MKGRLTAQQERFVRLVIEDGHTLVGAYRLAYPPRNGTRSAGAERVAARRLAHRPHVEQRMEQLKEERLANDPREMRSRANFVLGEILAKRLDPRYRRTALDVLKRLDEQERAAARADREAYRTIVAQMAALDATEDGRTKSVHSASGRPRSKEQPPVDLDQLINEIAQIAAERRRSRELEPPLIPELDSCQDDPRQGTREATPLLEEVVPERQGVVSENALAKEVSEGENLEVRGSSTVEDAAETEVSRSASDRPESEVKFELVPIPGRFPPQFRRVRRG